jgi:hypothetical protein
MGVSFLQFKYSHLANGIYDKQYLSKKNTHVNNAIQMNAIDHLRKKNN